MLVRNNRYRRWWAATWRMGATCWFCRDFSACWCGTIGIEGSGCQREGWGLKDTVCWLCGDLSACWCGKIGIEGGGRQRGGWEQRVGFVVTFRFAGAGKSTLKTVVSSWGHECFHMPDVWAKCGGRVYLRRVVEAYPRDVACRSVVSRMVVCAPAGVMLPPWCRDVRWAPINA